MNQIKPKLRLNISYDLHSYIRGAVDKAIRDNVEFPYQTCINCFHFNERNEECQLFKARPPARVIAFGCKEHQDKDEIHY